MNLPTPRLTWTRDATLGDWRSRPAGFTLRREIVAFGRRGWALYQSVTRLGVFDSLAEAKRYAEGRDPARVQALCLSGAAPTPAGEPALPADPFERTVAVCTRLLAARGLEEGFDEATAKALGADPLVLRERRDEVIAAAQRAHAALMAA